MEESERCIQGPHRNGVEAQTRRVRYLDRNGREQMTAGMCQRHAGITAARYRREGYEGVWTVPVTRSPREIQRPARAARVQMIEVTNGMVETYRMATRTSDTDATILTGLTVALFSRYLEETKIPKLDAITLDPYPGTVAELAEEFVRVVVDLEESGVVRGLLRRCVSLLELAAHRIEASPCETCGRPREGVSKGCAECQRRHPTMYAKAYGGCGACSLSRHGITNRCNQCPERTAGDVPLGADVSEGPS